MPVLELRRVGETGASRRGGLAMTEPRVFWRRLRPSARSASPNLLNRGHPGPGANARRAMRVTDSRLQAGRTAQNRTELVRALVLHRDRRLPRFGTSRQRHSSSRCISEAVVHSRSADLERGSLENNGLVAAIESFALQEDKCDARRCWLCSWALEVPSSNRPRSRLSDWLRFVESWFCELQSSDRSS